MATDQWIQGVSGSFADPSNWSRGAVPKSSDSTVITAPGAYTVTSAASTAVLDLNIQNATLDLTSGTFSVGTGKNFLTVGSSATIDIESGATLQVTGFSMNVEGSINVAAGAKLQFFPTPQPNEPTAIRDFGTISLGGTGSELDLDGLISPSITSTIQGGGTIAAYKTGVDFYGDVIANMASTPLTFISSNLSPYNGDMDSGDFQAIDGATLILQSADLEQDSVAAVGSQSVVELSHSSLYGGNISTQDGGTVEVVGTVWLSGGYGNALINHGPLMLEDQSSLLLGGSILNYGPIFCTQGTANIGITSTLDLYGHGSVTLSDNSDNLVQGFTTRETLINVDNTISGAGTFLGQPTSENMSNARTNLAVDNTGTINADGTNALIFDQMKLKNGPGGLFEASGTGGLAVNGGTFKNSGTVEALDGSRLVMGSDASLANNANGVLSAGTWNVTDEGNGASLTLSGPAITDDKAMIYLTGADSEFWIGTSMLEDSLGTIDTKGRLGLLGDRSWTSSVSMTDKGRLQLEGGAFTSGALAVASTGLISGFGTIDESLTNDGQIEAKDGTLAVTGSIAGSGNAKIDAHAALELGGMANTGTVTFGGKQAALTLDEPAAFNGTIANWGFVDTIDLANTQATSAAIDNNMLTVGLADHTFLQYALDKPAANTSVILNDDQHGGVNLTLHKIVAAASASVGRS